MKNLSSILYALPTGEGTGLGLSLSYDIIKAHGGEIIVKTKEGEGSEFVIMIPFV
jgi:two-component system, NtrC family, sensor kinase